MQKDLHVKITQMLQAIEPSAEVFLYGIMTKGKGLHQKQLDFLILLDGEINSARSDRIRHLFYSVEKETNHHCHIIIKNRKEWNNPNQNKVPLHTRLKHEGIYL
jgi:predicted nucleotidyltransferase